ncbi:hypothetical protein ACFQ49_16405 [Kroppenstedtia eburnea]|uniref:Uncharacterized protein n=1 Tax=Kroppenstedtia eburnea TaxID=714067 RepID=A0A1N7JIP2_9BACL|nr:hypothetical protein [Kroppenstedtia eburnea]QKI83569.1 hypothetical protein GXN75_17170 [Kroppenstedtia eburnea]SIS49197.1 hypothetical protein SAMN05421790_102147 [Kroppenstedtia eburnea]
MTPKDRRDTGEGHFALHGGTHFTPKASPEEINRFVQNLPPGRRETFYEIMKELSQADLITLRDDGLLADGEGKIGGSDEC